MEGSSRQGLVSWTAARNVTLDNKTIAELSFGERVFSAGGAAFMSAVIVNPLDVAKTRLQAQAAGGAPLPPYNCFCSKLILQEVKFVSSVGNNHYKGTLDVFYKIIQQEGFSRLWRGTNAGLALAVPSVGIYMPLYDVFRNYLEDLTLQNYPGIMPSVPLIAGSLARSIACITCYPIELARTRMQAFQDGRGAGGVWHTLRGVVSPVESAHNHRSCTLFQALAAPLQNYRRLWTGLGAQLARDVPFSALCWSSLEPLRRKLLSWTGDEGGLPCVVGANFCAGFVAGSFSAAATCPLDVARTRCQIEKDPARALNMTTRQTLIEIWRGAGIRGLFAGGGPRVARAGPSVGIVVSFYEIVKYKLQGKQMKDLQ